MDEKYTNSLISSVRKYIEELQYLAKNDLTTIRILNLYKVIHELYMASSWFNFTTLQKNKIETLLNGIVLHNSNIILPLITSGAFYVNVNTNQNDYTWDKIIDDRYTITAYDLNLLMYPDELDPELPF